MKGVRLLRCRVTALSGRCAARDRLQRRSQHDFVTIDQYAKVDVARTERTGFPEVVFGEGKTAAQIAEIFATLVKSLPDQTALATRVSSDKWTNIQPLLQAAGVLEVEYNSIARIMMHKPVNHKCFDLDVKACVVAAGTSDLPVAEEACLTLSASGYSPTRVYDVGVAGIQRLFAKLDEIRSADAVIVVAGMDGALPSVVRVLQTAFAGYGSSMSKRT